ncbi:MAG: pseudouridine synthase [Oscillospiraceae bacterium]
MRIDKYIADCGVGTRSEVKKMIKKNRVKVPGLTSIKPETQIDADSAIVLLDGEELQYREFIYLILNKPKDYISATWDKSLPVVLDLVPDEYLHFEPFPLGRLDIDTEGMCVISNDGKLAHKLLGPTNHIPKTYYAEIDGCVTDMDVRAFKRGVVLDDGYMTKPAILTILESGEKSKIELVIVEGKFHQVKRMFESVGKSVVYLKRTKMNHLELDKNLKLGEIRELTNEELELLRYE